jgi:capsular polysaccharide transport system permease protein
MKLFRSAMFWLFFLIPFVAGVTYYVAYASNQYEALAHFTIEKNGQNQSDPLGALTGLPGSVSSSRDALIIKDFIESHEVIERTKNDFDIRKIYSRKDKDWLSRLDDEASIEEVVEYWQDKVQVEFDSASGIITLNVLAFEREEAITVINAILRESEELVNNLSVKSRQDSLVFAKEELKNAEIKLKEARQEVRIFRDKETLSPEKSAESKLSLVESLEAERASAEAKFESLKLSYPNSSVKVQAAKNSVAALKKQIVKERARSSHITGANSKTMSTIISKHEELLTEQGFAEKSYEFALLNLEKARIEATKQHRYLSVIVYPSLPEDPAKPNQPNDFIVLFLSCLLLWGILSLIIASVKDHAGWA